MLTVAGASAAGAAIGDASQILLPSLRWFVTVSAAPAVSPVVADGYVYLPLKPGIVAAHRIADGAEAWRVKLAAEQELASAPRLLFVPAAEAVHALASDTGRELWLAATGTVTAPLLVREGWLIAASGSTLFALRASDGAQIWKREGGDVLDRPTIDGDVLYVSYSDGRVAALDLQSGSTRWETKLGGAGTEPLVAGDRVYVGSSDGNFYALKLKNGEFDWSYPVRAPLLGRAAVDDERVYVTAMDNLLRALDRTSGNQRWRRDLSFRPLAGPVLIGSAVTVPGTSAALGLFNAKDGQPLKQITLDAALAIPPGFGTEPGETLMSVAAITGSLTDQWKLWLYGPLPPAPAGPPIEPLSALPGRLVQPGT